MPKALKKNSSVPLLLSLHLFPIREAEAEDEETGKNKFNVCFDKDYL